MTAPTTDTETTEELSNLDTAVSPTGDTDAPEATGETQQSEPETFPREYVEQLRTEAAEHRTRAKDRDDLAHRLHVELVRATGRLADPDDLPFADEHLADPAALSAAIDALLQAKPHLASRRPTGDVGQGARTSSEPVDLAAILRANAG